MNKKEKLARLKEAEAAIRLVEFSYPIGHPIRHALFRFVANTFSFIGEMPNIIKSIAEEDETNE